MNDNQARENNIAIAETMNLSEETITSSAVGIISYIKSFFKKIRTNFSLQSERSILSSLLENIYIKALSAKVRTASIFLLSFSVVSLIINYFFNSSLSVFISDIDTFSSIVLLIVSLVLFTSNKSVHSLISGSKILGSLSIVYSEQSVMLENEDKYSRGSAYSTPFFLGIICGIFTVIYPVSVISSFVLSLICILFIFNRPECGMLFIIAILPILSRPLLLVLTCITFLALLYRYMLGKRHIDFNISTMLMIISAVYVAIRCAVSSGNVLGSRFYIYITFYISCITAINLIRSTAMFRRVVLVLIRMTRAFTVIIVLYYLSNMFFGTNLVEHFLGVLNIGSLVHSLTSATFAAPFLAMSVPLNFAYLVGINKGKETFKNVVFLLLLIASLLYVSSYALILICILSCVAILIFYNIKFSFLIIPAPFAAYALQKLFNSIPLIYRMSASANMSADIATAVDIIKTNPLFGAGPDITDYSGNMLINILVTFGLVGVILLSAMLISMTARTIKSISASSMQSNKSRFLSIGLLCSQLSFLAVCIFTDLYCDMNVIFMFSAIMSASFASGKCYKADYIDETVVREYRNK